MFIALIIHFAFYSCSAQIPIYKRQLITTIEKINQKDTIGDDLLLEMIPKSQQEYDVFYSLTYPDLKDSINLESYYQLVSLFYFAAINNVEVYKYLLEMSDYVDGEFAESYFEDLENIIIKNTKLFCSAYSHSNVKKIKKLKEDHQKYCK